MVYGNEYFLLLSGRATGTAGRGHLPCLYCKRMLRRLTAKGKVLPYNIFSCLFEVKIEECFDFIEWNEACAVIQVDVACAGHDIKFFRFGRTLVGIFAEFA